LDRTFRWLMLLGFRFQRGSKVRAPGPQKPAIAKIFLAMLLRATTVHPCGGRSPRGYMDRPPTPMPAYSQGPFCNVAPKNLLLAAGDIRRSLAYRQGDRAKEIVGGSRREAFRWL
jgi:hypothetical protein